MPFRPYINEIELWEKDQTNPWDLLSPMARELTSLGHIFTLPGRVKEKRAILRFTVFFAINFGTKKYSRITQAPSCFSLQVALKHILFALGRSS